MAVWVKIDFKMAKILNYINSISEKKIILFIVGVVFLVSLTLSFGLLHLQPAVDAAAYDNIALNLVQGNGYVENSNISPEKDFAIARVGPGYELFLAGIYKIFGHHYRVIWLFQAIFQALIVLFSFLISRQVFGKDWKPIIGYLAAALVGFWPDLLIASSMLLAENLGIFLMMVSVYFFFRYYDSGKWADFFLFSIFFVFFALVRSQLAIFFLVFSVLFVLKKEWLKMAIFFLIVIVLFSPWVIRNYYTYKEFVPFNAALGGNLWIGNHMGATGEMEIDYQPLIEYAQSHTPVAMHEKGIEEFKRFILEHPLEFVKITAKRVSIFFSLARPTGFWPNFTPKQQAVSAFLSFLFSVLIFPLGIAGAVIFLRKIDAEKKKKRLFFLAMAASIPISVIFILVESRYRYPLYPFLAILGGFFISEMHVDVKKVKFLIISFSLLLVNGIFDFILNFEKFWDKIKNVLH